MGRDPCRRQLVKERSLVELGDRLRLGGVVRAMQRLVIREVVEGVRCAVAIDADRRRDVGGPQLQAELRVPRPPHP